MMKRLFALFLVLTAVSCGPARHVVNVEMRYPSKSGLELAGKTISVVYVENDNAYGKPLLEGMVDGFASSLQQEYFNDEVAVEIYSIRPERGAIYSSKDSLMNILMDNGTDVVFFFDSLKVGALTMGETTPVAYKAPADSSYISAGNLPFMLSIYCYDSMNKEDKVFTYSAKSIAAPHAYSDGKQSRSVIVSTALETLDEVGVQAGKSLSASFKSQWQHEQYSIIYFESEKWYKAALYAEQYYWKQAMDIWFELLNSNDVLKRSSAAYNISVACYMLGDYELATLWLDRSDQENKLQFSEAMRKRIKARI